MFRMQMQENNVEKQRTCYALFFCCAQFSPIYEKQPRPYHWHWAARPQSDKNKIKKMKKKDLIRPTVVIIQEE